MHPDFIMREIEFLTLSLANQLFNKNAETLDLFDEESQGSASGVLYHRLKKMVADGQINQAEDALFDEIDANPLPTHLNAAIQFYYDLSKLPAERLEAANFTKHEIMRGLEDIANIYQVDLDFGALTQD